MQKPIALPLASSLAALFITAAASPLAMAGDSEHSFSGNMTLTSEYVFRGYSQTNDKPALQGGIDYAHSSGAYVGLWASNISWISDSTPGASASLEMDVYAGYGGDIGNGMSYDVGVLTYLYPGNGVATGNADPDTTEVYAALGYALSNGSFPFMFGCGVSYESAVRNTSLEGYALWGKLAILF